MTQQRQIGFVGSTKQAAQVGDTRWARIVGDHDTFVAQIVELAS
jgi:hypothetical protein